MAPTVRLSDIIDSLEMQLDETSSFLDLDTGQVETVSRDLLGHAEESEDPLDLPEWQKPEWEVAKRMALGGNFKKLPTKFDVHEWSILQEFSYSVESARIREELLDAIHGRGAFRYFKLAVRRHRIEAAWSTFRAEALRKIAIDWCEKHKIDWQP